MISNLENIRHLFEQRIGLDSEIISEESWNRKLKERMAICEIEDISVYSQRLFSSSIEFQEFVELLVVPETWFFREKLSIEFIVDYAQKEWIKTPKFHPMRILCLPCSSGEEPYSIAMMFVDKNFPLNLLHIDAIDISKKALAKAEIGEYNKNSFRTKDLSFRDRFFYQDGQNYILNESIRQLVHFSYGNLFDTNWTEKKISYDVIFCRNLFIYLHASGQKTGTEIFKNLLNPNGIFIVSPAEAEIVRANGFISFGPPKTCTFKPRHTEEKVPILIPHEPLIKIKKIIDTGSKSWTIEKKLASEKKLEYASLKEAKRLADLGKLPEALTICHECLKECNKDPKIYFLIGLIEHALGNEKISEEYFLKTVYLDPNYYDALVYLALIAENKGEFAQAELFRTRAERLNEKKIKPPNI